MQQPLGQGQLLFLHDGFNGQVSPTLNEGSHRQPSPEQSIEVVG